MKEQLPACHEDGNGAASDHCVARRPLPDLSQALKVSSPVTSFHGHKDLEVSVLALPFCVVAALTDALNA